MSLWLTALSYPCQPQHTQALHQQCPALCCPLQGTGKLKDVDLADWTAPTLPSWRHSNWVGVWDPWPVVFAGPKIWYRTVREIVTLERMHRAFASGLMQYGMMRAVKKPSSEGGSRAAAGASTASPTNSSATDTAAGSPISRKQTVGLSP